MRPDAALENDSAYLRRKAEVAARCSGLHGAVRVRKNTTSNLFRYQRRDESDVSWISLGNFNHILGLDENARTLDVEGLATYEQIVSSTLERGFLPTVAPELKHITIGGAIVGIGIESSCFRHGFVHDGLLEADVLLMDGSVVTCRADNEHADLFHGLPNSYGTLGYVLRARIRLVPARGHVRVQNSLCTSVEQYLQALEQAAADHDNDFVEGLFYGRDELYLTVGRMVDEAPEPLEIHHEHIYYKLLRRDTSFHLSTIDYIFRYDPDWFWNIPEGGFYDLYRRYAPRSLRNSGFYNRYVKTKARIRRSFGYKDHRQQEPLIQDWELPWENAAQFVEYALDRVDIQGYPWVAAPVRTSRSPTCYPIQPGKLYLNIGCYCSVDRPRSDVDFYYTRILDDKCFQLGGIKMLYSSTFLEKEAFDRIYNGDGYAKLKLKYDAAGRLPTLFDKTVIGR